MIMNEGTNAGTIMQAKAKTNFLLSKTKALQRQDVRGENLKDETERGKTN